MVINSCWHHKKKQLDIICLPMEAYKSYKNSKIQTVGNCIVEIMWFSSTNKLQEKQRKGKGKLVRLKDTKDLNHPDVKVLEIGSDDGCTTLRM